jgi:PAS domain S-box-containing protein
MASSIPQPPVFSADDDLNRRLVESFPGGMVQVAMDGSIVQANELAQRILGLSYDELTHRFIADFKTQTIWEDGTACDPDDYPVTRCLKTGATQPAATIGVRRPDGQFSWSLFTAAPILDPASRQQTGAIVRFVDITDHKNSEMRLRELKDDLVRCIEERTASLQAANDELKREIAERRQMESLLRESQRFAEGLAQAAPYALYVYDIPKRRTVFVNQQAARLLGYSLEELQEIAGQIEQVAIHPDYRPEFEKQLLRVAHAQDSEVVEFEFLARRSDGQWRWLRTRDLVFARADDETVQQIIGMVEDVTEYKQAVTAREEAAAQLQFITEHAPDFILEVDRQGTILFINRVIPPNTAESVVGTSFRQWIPESDYDTYLQAIERVFETGSSERFETISAGLDGVQCWYSCHVGPIVKERQIRSAVVIARDISERKQAEERLRSKQQLLKSLLALQERERKLIAAEIHDGLVQDVTGAKMLLEGSKHQLEAEVGGRIEPLNRVEELLGRAIAEGRRMIGDLRPLEVDEKGIVEMLRFLVAEETRRTARQIAFTHSVRFDRLDPLLEGTIFRIAQEALTNVRRHSSAQRAEIRLQQRGEWLLLEIRDDGIGFDLPTVAEDRYGVRGIIQRARLFGGAATINSSPGAGTRIQVELPVTFGFIEDKTT